MGGHLLHAASAEDVVERQGGALGAGITLWDRVALIVGVAGAEGADPDGGGVEAPVEGLEGRPDDEDHAAAVGGASRGKATCPRSEGDHLDRGLAVAA